MQHANRIKAQFKRKSIVNTMTTLPSERELKEAFSDFGQFTFQLLESIDANPGHLKFAAVNSQIALELFLKYLYVKQGKVHEIQSSKRGKLVNKFKEFQDILGHFYSSRQWTLGEKKELITLMQTRNSIVHRGQRTEWDEELAESVVRTLFFIHSTAWSELGETLLFDNYAPHDIADVQVWRDGVQSFVAKLEDMFGIEALTCLSCSSRTVISGDVLVLEEGQDDEHLICLNCLTAIDTSHEARLIECYVCEEKSYLLDAFNEQEEQMYVAKCSECSTDTWVRKCAYCEEFYHPFASDDEVLLKGVFFCCDSCSQSYTEEVN